MSKQIQLTLGISKSKGPSETLRDIRTSTGIRFSLRAKRLFEITEVELTRVDCKCKPRSDCILLCTESYGMALDVPVFRFFDMADSYTLC